MNATSPIKLVAVTNDNVFDLNKAIECFEGFAIGLRSYMSGASEIETSIATFRENKIQFGKSVKSCMYRPLMLDVLAKIFPDVKQKTRDNYLTAFIVSVRDNVPFDKSFSKGTKKSGAVTGTSPKQDRENPALDALFKCLKTAGGLDVLYMMQAAYDNADGDLVEIAIDLLKAEGYEITAE
jgi:hypothetical protein